jgi:hypothetical protein
LAAWLARKYHTPGEATRSVRARKLLNRRLRVCVRASVKVREWEQSVWNSFLQKSSGTFRRSRRIPPPAQLRCALKVVHTDRLGRDVALCGVGFSPCIGSRRSRHSRRYRRYRRSRRSILPTKLQAVWLTSLQSLAGLAYKPPPHGLPPELVHWIRRCRQEAHGVSLRHELPGSSPACW